MAIQRLFITGGSGFIGSVVIEQAKGQGKDIYALSRTETSDEKLRKLGAIPIRGDLMCLDVLKTQASLADGVIHLATAHEPTASSFEEAVPVDIDALNALAKGIEGTGKPLVACSGTLSAQADPSGDETDETAPLQASPLQARYRVEAHALGLASRGIRAISVRIAANTYGRGGSIIAQYMKSAREHGGVNCVAGGQNRLTACHVDDCAALLLLAAEKGRAGEVYNAGASTTVTARELSEAIGDVLQVPVRFMTLEEAKDVLGEIGVFFVTHDNRASGRKAREELGWNPRGVGLLEDIRSGSYVHVAASLASGDHATGGTYFQKS